MLTVILILTFKNIGGIMNKVIQSQNRPFLQAMLHQGKSAKLLGKTVSLQSLGQRREFLTVVQEWQKGFLLTFGKAPRDIHGRRRVLNPGLKFYIPFVQNIVTCNVWERTFDLPAQQVPTSDKATLYIDAAVFYKIVDTEKAVFDVESVHQLVIRKSQEVLRNELGSHTLSEVLTNRETYQKRIKESVRQIGLDWGVEVRDLVLNDIKFPESMERSLGRKAEAEAEGQAKLTHAQYELESAMILSKAGEIYKENPAGMKLREMNIQLSMAKEGKGTNTIFFPIHEIQQMLKSVGKI